MNNIRVCVLLSTYNGQSYLSEQLDSLFQQKTKENVELRILVRDDGSTDATVGMLEKCEKAGKITLHRGANVGVEKSFMELVRNAPEADYYAFCDQDDYWLEDKVQRAVDCLEAHKEGQALLYYCAFCATDKNLKPLEKAGQHERPAVTDFGRLLLNNPAPGCVEVFNAKTLRYMQEYYAKSDDVPFHDWLAIQTAALFGEVIYDEDANIFYRQHGNNAIGHEHNKLKKMIKNVRRSLFEQRGSRSKAAKALLAAYDEQITDAAKRDALAMLSNYQHSIRQKKRFMEQAIPLPSGVRGVYYKFLILFNQI